MRNVRPKAILNSFLVILLLFTTVIPLTVSAFTDAVCDFNSFEDDPNNLGKFIQGVTGSDASFGNYAKMNMISNALGRVGGDKSVLLRSSKITESSHPSAAVIFGGREVTKNPDGVTSSATSVSIFVAEQDPNGCNLKAGFTYHVVKANGDNIDGSKSVDIEFQKPSGSASKSSARTRFNIPKAANGGISTVPSLTLISEYDRGGQWYNLTCVSNDESITFYLDGEIISTFPTVNLIMDSENPTKPYHPGAYIKYIEPHVGFNGDFPAAAPATTISWTVLDNFRQSATYNPADSDTKLTPASGSPYTISYPIFQTGRTHDDARAIIEGVAQGTTIGQMLAKLAPATGGSIYAVKYKDVALSNLTANFKDTNNYNVADEFTTTLLQSSDVVDLATKVVSVAVDGSMKIYDIDALGESEGGGIVVTNAGIYNLNVATGKIEVPSYTTATRLISQITTNVPDAKIEIISDYDDQQGDSSFVGILCPEVTMWPLKVRVTTSDGSAMSEYQIAYVNTKLKENQAITIPAISGGLLASLDLTKKATSGAPLKYQVTIGANNYLTVGEIIDNTLYVGGLPVSHITDGINYKIKIETEIPKTSSANTFLVRGVWVNGTKCGEDISISLASPVGTGITGARFMYADADFTVNANKSIVPIGEGGYQLNFGNTKMTSDFIDIDFYNPTNLFPVIQGDFSKMVVSDLLINPNKFKMRQMPGKIFVDYESKISLYAPNGTLLATDTMYHEDPEDPDTTNDRPAEMLLPIQTGMKLVILSKDGENTVTYSIKVGADGPASPFYIGGQPVFSVNEISGDTLTYKKSADSDGVVILAAYKKTGELLELALVSDDDEAMLLGGKYEFQVDLDISELDLENVIFKCMRWDGYGNIIPLDIDVDILD